MSGIPGGLRVLLCIVISAIPGFSQTSRPFFMASSAIQAFPQGQGVVFENSWPGYTFPELAPDVDVISVQPEFLGIPYDKFAQGPDLPNSDPWAQEMISLASASREAGKTLLVQIALIRINLVGNATYPEGLVQVQPFWAPTCPDLTGSQFSTLETSYVNYALWVARTFSPAYLAIMLEPNLYYTNCGGDTASWEIIVKIEQAVYDAVKAAYPSTILFPSFNLEALYGQQVKGFDQAQYNALKGMKRDRLGLVSFPGIYGNPYLIPIDYYTRIQDLNPSEPRVVVTETGWSSSSIDYNVSATGTCNSIYSEDSFESAFLNFVIYSGYVGNFDMITWWSDRDEMPATVVSDCYPAATPPNYPECKGDVWCAAVNYARTFYPPGTSPAYGELVFKAFGSLGLRAYDGTPRDGVLSLWQKFLQLPIDVPVKRRPRRPPSER